MREKIREYVEQVATDHALSGEFYLSPDELEELAEFGSSTLEHSYVITFADGTYYTPELFDGKPKTAQLEKAQKFSSPASIERNLRLGGIQGLDRTSSGYTICKLKETTFYVLEEVDLTREFTVGEKLRKIYDGRIVTINDVQERFIVLNGDFEPNHLVMKDKVKHYYSRVEEDE